MDTRPERPPWEFHYEFSLQLDPYFDYLRAGGRPDPVRRPVIPVTVSIGTTETDMQMLIDTGSDHCVLPRPLAQDYFGIADGEEEPGAETTEPANYHGYPARKVRGMVGFEQGAQKFAVPAWFVIPGAGVTPLPYARLGRIPVVLNFALTMRRKDVTGVPESRLREDQRRFGAPAPPAAGRRA